MKRNLSVAAEHYPIAGSFVISRGARTTATVVTCTITEGDFVGRGECVPYARYGESVESVIGAIEAIADKIEDGIDRIALQNAMPAGAARNAVDCALWDLELKAGRIGRDAIGGAAPRPLTTAFTISLGAPEKMAADARAAAHLPLLKIKLGGDGDHERMAAVAEAAPASRLIADANEGWSADMLEEMLEQARRCRFELVEQPVAASQDGILRGIRRPVPVCADESAHTSANLGRLLGLYDAVNIKLDKAGGLSEAIVMRDQARALGLSVMVGCMVGTSLAMAPAVLLAQGAEYVDLDGPLLLSRDRVPGLHYSGSLVHPPQPELWG